MCEPSRFSDPGYTPSRQELEGAIRALLEATDDEAVKVERALGRAGLAAAELASENLKQSEPVARVRLVRLVARVARLSGELTLVEELCARLQDSDPRVQRAAIIGLGKLRQPGIEDALLDYAARGHEAPEQRVLIEALGKIGGPRAVAWLQSQSSDDAFTARLLARSQLMLARTSSRPELAVPVRLDVALGSPQRLLWTCREGLESIVANQVRALGELQVTRGRVCLPNFTGMLSQALIARSALGVGIELPLDKTLSSIEAILDSLKRAELYEWMEQSNGCIPRVRLNFLGQGHQRAAVWDLQTRFVRDELPLIADPSAASWEICVDISQGRLDILPKRFDDPRFAWRVEELPSASHPTIAAALARVAGVRPDDVIWDPFVGSGLELIERALLGPYRIMYGTDTDERALAAARANLAAAKVKHVTLYARDARTAPVRDITAIITNPPLGARLVRDGSLGELLESTMTQGWRVLVPGGRWVWLSPMPAHTASFAHHLGFNLERRGLVDVGGLTPELQIFHVPERPSRPAPVATTATARKGRIVR
jgi:23S rRNA G2445 N2-methylase RlmL